MRGTSRGSLVSILFFATLVVSACAAPTVAVTNRAMDYQGRPVRLYVISSAGMGWGPEFSGAFRSKFQQIARQCGTNTSFEEVSGLELDQNGPLARANAFGADTILTISHGGGVVSGQGGARLSASYGATLRDVKQSRAVWRGNFSFSRGGTAIAIEERGAVLAIDITNSLKKDGILPGCSQITLGQNGRLDPAAVPKPGSGAPGLPAAPVYSSQAPNAAPSLRDLQDLLPKQ
ncbi:hypothetical protein AB4156_11815 [Cupriavidus sp. 2MCAB6]|uniref:hypothetical protein n=1 Tax=Cupriavidus sp. 2MCAB6 TaxID=3232981 RepID=UPI003F8E678A